MARPLSKPRETCPFSGEPLQFVETGSGIQVRGKGWISAQFFITRKHAEYAFSHNHGTVPAFPAPYSEVQVIGTRTAPDPEGVAAARRIESKVENDAGQFAEEIAHGFPEKLTD